MSGRLYLARSSGHDTVEKTIGPGEVGRKTASLRRDRQAIEGSQLFYPPNVAITPGFFGRFLLASGALEAKDEAEAKARLMATDFTDEERQSIESAIVAFPEILRTTLMVRSDDYSRGVGLWHSGAVSTDLENERRVVRDLVGKVEIQAKLVLASDLGDNVRTFKRIKSLNSNPGVLLMPAFGEVVYDSGLHLTPPLSMNYLGGPGVWSSLAGVGVGIGGSNDRFAPKTIGTGIPFGVMEVGWPKSRWNAIKLDTGKIEEINVEGMLMQMGMAFQMFPDTFFDLNKKLIELVGKIGPRYLEIVKDDLQRPIYVVVQSSPVEIRTVETPELSPTQEKQMETDKVMGSKVVRSDLVRYGELEPDLDQREFNARNRGYILVVKIGNEHCDAFMERWQLDQFSNAGAIIMQVDEIFHPMGSHVGGVIRELDIPVLAGRVFGPFMATLQQKRVAQVESIVYANEFEEQGFLATDQVCR